MARMFVQSCKTVRHLIHFLWAALPSHLNLAEIQDVDFLNNKVVYILGPCYLFSLPAVVIVIKTCIINLY